MPPERKPPPVETALAQNPNYKGNVAEAKIAAAATELGIPVLRPMVEHTRYDLAFEVGGHLHRIQCKWANRRDGIVTANLMRSRRTLDGFERVTYSGSEIDAIAAYCGDLDRCYLIPIGVIEGMHQLTLRLESPLNGQRATIRWAADYEFAGAIAQLGERCRGTAEAVGSSPTGSITRFDGVAVAQVGAHEFRERFGYYMEQASAGQDITVTRRGRPAIRMTAAQPALPAEPQRATQRS